MSDFTTEELYEAVDRAVVALLARNRITEPPMDALELVQQEFRYAVRIDDDDDEEPRQYGDRPKPRPRPRELVFKPTQSPTARQSLAARACAKEMIPGILATLGIVPGTEQKSSQTQLVGFVVPRLLLPTRWYAVALRKTNNDLARLREQFSTVAYEILAMRMLDFEDPCAISIVDDGSVGTRRSNFAQLGKALGEAEQLCVTKVQESEEAQTVRRDGWTARGWPIPSGPFNRIILRSVPDDV